MRVLLLGLGLVFLLLGAVLGYANHAPVAVDLLFGQFEWPLIALLFAAFAVGVLLMTVVSSIRHWGLSHRCRKAEKRLAAVENELRHLRQVSAASSSPRSTVSPHAITKAA